MTGQRAGGEVVGHRRMIGRDARYEWPMWRTWIGPWRLVAGHWFRLAFDQWGYGPQGVRRWVRGT